MIDFLKNVCFAWSCSSYEYRSSNVLSRKKLLVFYLFLLKCFFYCETSSRGWLRGKCLPSSMPKLAKKERKAIILIYTLSFLKYTFVDKRHEMLKKFSLSKSLIQDFLAWENF